MHLSGSIGVSVILLLGVAIFWYLKCIISGVKDIIGISVILGEYKQ